MMKTVNSLSGGRSSSYMAVHYPADYEVFSLVCIDDLECAPRDRSIIQYVNAKLEKFIPEYGEFIATAEDDKTLYAMRDLEQYLGREIIWVRGVSFDKLIDEPSPTFGKRSLLPSWARRYCTLEMKLLPIFQWWFNNVGEKVNMRIGFRFDEFGRMESFMNNEANKGGFKIPVACSTKGKRFQRHEIFDWRQCSFPMARGGVVEPTVKGYWKKDGWIGGTLWEPRRQIEFPDISNCVWCFHKKPDTLAIQWNINTIKMRWAGRQEHKGMGTWLDSKVTYEQIGEHALSTPYTIEMLREFGASCDSGGCTD